MATDRNFQQMLNEYLPNELLKEEMVKRDYFLQNVDKDNNWKGGNMVVPFRGASASTSKFGSLPAADAINQTRAVRGNISSQPELWGALIFNERDLMEHDKLSDQNLLKLLPDEIDDFMGYMKQVLSLSFTVGEVVARATADGDASGNITLDRFERLEVGQPVQLVDDNTAAAKYWVKSINMETGVVVLTTDMALTTLANISAYTVAQNARVLYDGNETAGNRVSNIKKMLLSAANGGDANLYGVSKLAYPYLQAINVSGASISASNILDKIFDAQTRTRNLGKGLPDKVVMSYKHLGSILKIVELSKGAFKMVDSPKASLYGWTEVEIVGVKGKLTCVAIQEMDDDFMPILDLKALKIYSNGFFKKRKAPDGKEYFEIRNTTGYQYIVDICFFGDIVLERPSRCGIIHSIPNY